MEFREAIEILRKEADGVMSTIEYCKPYVQEEQETYVEAVEVAIEAMEKQEKYEAQWIDDIRNPLEPLKITSALNSEIFKFEYRKEHKPKDISILDYTIIAALKECLDRRTGGGEE